VLQADFGGRLVVYDWLHAAEMLDGAALVINATSLGMTGKPDLRLPLDRLAAGTVATDLVYTPLITPFLTEAQARGAHIVDGLGMLLHQGAPGFERWFGHRPEVDDATRAAVLGL
jgi:shikimate dehydrogenase